MHSRLRVYMISLLLGILLVDFEGEECSPGSIEGHATASQASTMEVKVFEVGVWGGYVVILSDMEETAFLPIWIGMGEAVAISRKLEDKVLPRPMTHDLIVSMLKGMNARVVRVLIDSLTNETYFAKITLETPSSTVEIDSRPSDAIAVALRSPAPIYVSTALMEENGLRDLDMEGKDKEKEKGKEQKEREGEKKKEKETERKPTKPLKI